MAHVGDSRLHLLVRAGCGAEHIISTHNFLAILLCPLVCSDSNYKILWVLLSNRNLLLTNLKAEKAEIQVPTNLVSVEEPFLMDGLFQGYTFQWMGPTSLNSLCKGANSNCRHS